MFIVLSGILFVLSDNDKFTEIYRQYAKLIYYKAYEILKDHGLSEDAASEAFIRIYKNLHKLADEVPSPPTAAFAVTVVRNVALTMQKKRAQQQADFLETDIADGVDMEENIAAAFAEKNIYALLESLGEEVKAVFLLYYAYNMSFKEISGALGIKANTAAVRLHRAKKKLADMLALRWEMP